MVCRVALASDFSRQLTCISPLQQHRVLSWPPTKRWMQLTALEEMTKMMIFVPWTILQIVVALPSIQRQVLHCKKNWSFLQRRNIQSIFHCKNCSNHIVVAPRLTRPRDFHTRHCHCWRIRHIVGRPMSIPRQLPRNNYHWGAETPTTAERRWTCDGTTLHSAMTSC